MGRVTDRHRQLAAQLVDAWQTGDRAATLEQRIAQLLADEDDRRVPIEAVGTAYARGRRDVIRAVRAELARTDRPIESDVAFGRRLSELLDNLAERETPTDD